MIKSRAFLMLALLFFSISLIYASCEEGQIDINSAYIEDMMKIKWLGGTGATAQKVIDERPFGSVDELTKVSGIKESKLQDIKSQGLACVDAEDVAEEENVEESLFNITETLPVSDIKIENSSPEETELKAIDLNPKVIKSDVDSEVSGKRDYAIYGLLAFGVLLGLLFLIKRFIRKKNKNEFT